MHKVMTSFILALFLTVGFLIDGGGQLLAAGDTVTATPVPVKSAKDRKKVAPDAALYAVDPQPLTVTQCGQCHPSYFQDLKNDGGRHRFDCRKCHQRFHAHNPAKGNWAELMPDCGTCHKLPHGEKHSKCSVCHLPHSAGKVPATSTLLNYCADCHSGPATQLAKEPSAHSRLACNACHTEHGLIPSCGACHKPHYPDQGFAGCLECHPVHMPKQIAYGVDTNARTCGGCHGKVYSTWTKTPSKHGKVNCSACHTKHRLIPECSQCHRMPHSSQLHGRFPKCLTCHQNVHDLPVKQRNRAL